MAPRTMQSTVSCSRDPIEFGVTVELYLFVSAAPTVHSDPSGMVKIRASGQEASDLPSCSGEKFKKWDFVLDFDTNEDVCKDGYIVQQVTVTCTSKDCDYECKGDRCGPRKNSGSFKYWEVWEVNKGRVADRLGWSDKASLPVSNDSCGSYSQLGEVRYYCLKDTGTLSGNGWVSDRSRRYGEEYGCGTGAGDLFATSDEPKFWTNSNGEAGSTFRIFSVDWECCAKNRFDRKSKTTYKPKGQEGFSPETR